jgi:hypothetical protein
MRGPSVERLRRLRWRLTAIFTVMNTLGLLLLAPLVIILDANRSDEGVNNKLEVVSQSVIRLITDNVSLGLERSPRIPCTKSAPRSWCCQAVRRRSRSSRAATRARRWIAQCWTRSRPMPCRAATSSGWIARR